MHLTSLQELMDFSVTRDKELIHGSVENLLDPTLEFRLMSILIILFWMTSWLRVWKKYREIWKTNESFFRNFLAFIYCIPSTLALCFDHGKLLGMKVYVLTFPSWTNPLLSYHLNLSKARSLNRVYVFWCLASHHV